MNFKFYYVDFEYVRKLNDLDNKVEYHHGNFEKPYLGIVLKISALNYFVPLSSPKAKHSMMKESLTFIKLIDNDELIAVLNLNNMIPVPESEFREIDFNSITDRKYKILLQKEYNICKTKQNKIARNARLIRQFCLSNEERHQRLLSLCCDFRKLEEYSNNY